MRNSPFPRFSIGHPHHAFFPVGDRRGLVQGILEISDTTEMDVSDLVDFDLTVFPDVVRFDEETEVEIADFHGWTSHGGGFVSKLGIRRLRLEPGGRITGPVVWRTARSQVEKPARHLARSDVVGASSVAFLVLVSLVASYLALPALAVFLGLAVVSVCVIAWLAVSYARWRRGAIARMGSVWVYSPDRRLWASRDEVDVPMAA